MLVKNMTSTNGNKVPNQFIIGLSNGQAFQSYQTLISFYNWKENKMSTTDTHYSRTTSKYRNMFHDMYNVEVITVSQEKLESMVNTNE